MYPWQQPLLPTHSLSPNVSAVSHLSPSYHCPAANAATVTDVTIPSMSVPRRIGQGLLSVLSICRAVTIAFQPSGQPADSFDNLAAYSSQGPTLDGRVKPDIVAPGTVTSAEAQDTGKESCGLVTYGVSTLEQHVS